VVYMPYTREWRFRFMLAATQTTTHFRFIIAHMR
jgi:hypothetical protein